jgi:aminoglycoside phosphotransferase family enzyme/predicted kinase
MADSHSQDEIFAFLAERHPNVRRIDTHAAAVFLDGDHALKIKRAVRFPFLDYSTLAKRKAACDEEISVNRRFAPEIYRRVVPIIRNADGSLSIGGDGTPVEFAVEMERFDESQTLDHLAAAGPPDTDLIEAFASAIAASHAAAPVARNMPWVETILPIIGDNTTELRAGDRLPAADIDRLDEASRAAFSRVRNLLHKRSRNGYVRRCHGDLHLANVALIAGKPVLFDAIEFDPLIATTDILYDLAFPIMDFARYDRHRAANALLNGYLRRTADENLDALAPLLLFLSLRAAIRAKVLLARASEQPTLMPTVQKYFELALRSIRPSPPVLVAVGGLSGTGKSVTARSLAPSLGCLPGAVVLRTDAMRKQLFQVNETDKLSEDAYRPQITHKIYERLAQQAFRILSQGHSVVADGVFADERERTAIRDVAHKLNAQFAGLFLQANLETRLNRVGQRGPDASDATPAIVERQDKYDIGKLDWTEVDASGTPEQTLTLCLTRISEHGPAAMGGDLASQTGKAH